MFGSEGDYQFMRVHGLHERMPRENKAAWVQVRITSGAPLNGRHQTVVTDSSWATSYRVRVLASLRESVIWKSDLMLHVNHHGISHDLEEGTLN
jgi:hypothetical protein